ncbi:MAG: glutamine--fructose-6-phosphate transaminase (isomerizing), partial [Rhodanobacter sp.]
GSPLVIGVGMGENFIASDPAALGQVTDRFVYLEEGDIAQVKLDSYQIWNNGKPVQREIVRMSPDISVVAKGAYRHFMLKEIFE